MTETKKAGKATERASKVMREPKKSPSTAPAEPAKPTAEEPVPQNKDSKVPGGLWLKCPGCEATIFRKEMEARLKTCSSCGYHFTLGAAERIAITLDPETFEEHFADIEPRDRLAFHDRIPYSEKLRMAQVKSGVTEAAIVGTGKIEGIPVVLCVLDFSFLGGSMGEVVGEKVCLAAELAERENLPLVIFTASGGARMHEGAISLMQMARTCAALSRLRKSGGFSICIQTNPTTGGVTASFASVTDFVFSEPGALIGFAGPRVIETTIRQALPEGFQRAEFLLEKGQLDAVIPRDRMREELAKVLRYLPNVAK